MIPISHANTDFLLFSPFLFLTKVKSRESERERSKEGESICLSERIPRVNMFSLISAQAGRDGVRNVSHQSTALYRVSIPSFIEVFRTSFRKFPRLVGRSCS